MSAHTGTDRGLRERFAGLLEVFSSLATGTATTPSLDTVTLRKLLQRFVEVRKLADRSERTQASIDHERIQAFLNHYSECLEGYRQRQGQVADDFNLLDVMQLTGKEIRHSMVLAWLLDHDLRKLGTHAQGSLGFRLFLSELRLPTDYADSKYWVRREVAGDESIVDLEIACRGRFLIHIENKIWSHEGKDQTNREWLDMQRRAVDLQVGLANTHGLFLTPHGTAPANPSFRAIRWGQIARVLHAFGDRAKPADVRLFTNHYVRALERFIVTQDLNEKENADTADERS